MKTKNKFLPLIIIVGIVTMQDVTASPQVYGKANVSLNSIEAEAQSVTTEERWTLNSNASRLGVKGGKNLEEGLEAIYQLEYEVAVDDGQASSTDFDADCDGSGTVDTCATVKQSFKQRNIFVGLKGGFGQIIAGKHDTPTKMAQGKIDRFNDLPLGDIKNVLSGGENRENNILIYTSPKMSGIELSVGFILGEEEGTPGNDQNGLADSSSVSLKYSGFDNFWIALAADSEVDDMDISRVTAEYAFESFKLGVIVQSSEEVSSGLESSGYVVSGEYGFYDKWKLKAQYGADTQEPAAGDIENTIASLGVDYSLGNKTKIYAYGSSWEEDNQGAGITEEAFTFGVGTEVKF